MMELFFNQYQDKINVLQQWVKIDFKALVTNRL